MNFLLIVAGIIFYFIAVAVLFGTDVLKAVPLDLTVSMCILTFALLVLGATLASIISSRVKTLRAAQTTSAILPMLLMYSNIAITLKAGVMSNRVFAVCAVGVLLFDVVLIVIASTTWRREEVMARM